MKRVLLAVVLFGFAPASQAQEYGECREIAAQHSFMYEMSRSCGLKLREDTSQLGFHCVAKLSDFHRDVAIEYGKMIAEQYHAEHGTRACREVQFDFGPLIAN